MPDRIKKSADLRVQAEKALKQKPERVAANQQDMEAVIHELRVHQIELEMQNDELRQIQKDMDESKARYFNLYNLAPIGYITLSSHGLIKEANLTFVVMLNIPRVSLVGQPLSHFILPEDQDIYYHIRNALMKTDNPQACEFRMIRMTAAKIPEPEPLWVRMEAVTSIDRDNTPSIRATLSDISTLKAVELALAASLVVKDTLLQEVHHRVKNNLALISSLINLQQERIIDPQVVAEFSILNSRIQSMALVHDLLYKSKVLDKIDMQEYFGALVKEIQSIHSELSPHVQTNVNAHKVYMTLAMAVPCGLIVNELVSNAFKYAFPNALPGAGEENCQIKVIASQEGSAFSLCITDNGLSLPETFDWVTTHTLGLKLVRMLAQYQLKGTLQLDRTRGTTFYLHFSSPQLSSINL